MSEAVYVHIADDGGLLTIDGRSGKSEWVTLQGFERVIADARVGGRPVLVSKEEGKGLAVRPLELLHGATVDLVEAPVHPDAARAGSTTALMAFAFVGAAILVEDLLERGSPNDTKDDRGSTALMYGSNGGDIVVIRHLLDSGSDPNAQDDDGSSPLMFAAQHGNARIVKLLLNHGADPCLIRTDGVDSVEVAESNGHDRVAAFIRAVAISE